MHKRTLIKGATLVNEGKALPASLLVEDDHIEQILTAEETKPYVPADVTIDAAGCYLLPGVIDDHVHFREPGLTRKATIATESRAAAAGGVTTWLDMPNTLPTTTTAEALEDKLERACRDSCVNYGFFFGITKHFEEQLKKVDCRKVCGLKLFMGSTTGGMLVDDDDTITRLMEASGRLPVMVHCEDPAIINENMARVCAETGCADPDVRLHPVIRSEEACYASTLRAVTMARRAGARLHVAHVSTARELELFTPDDPQITAEACVPHLVFTDADYARLGTRIKCNPAVKTAADRAALRRALTDGRIACIGTDHAPHCLTEKTGGAARAVSGMPMVQFSLPAMLELVSEGVMSIERLVELMCHAPARLFGIESRGYLREGYKADLVLVRPDSPWTLTPNRIESRCGWSPLEGHTFRWRVEKTFCNGHLLYHNGRITDDYFRGQAVTYCR